MSRVTKRLLRPDRVRKVPRSFSWIDHRLIRDGHLLRLRQSEILLYFFLILVGDHQGLSYYSLCSISRHLKLPLEEIERARASLCDRSLIAHQAPLFQVLSVPETPESVAHPTPSAPRGDETLPIGEILQRVLRRNLHG